MPHYRKIATRAQVGPAEMASCQTSGKPVHQPLRIAIVTENFKIPITDGVTRTLARLLEHLQEEGHTAIVLGPASGTDQYAGAKIWGTVGIPLFCYPSLKLSFLRPAFINTLIKFKPDVIHFVDPVWLGAQTLPAVEHYLPNVPRVSSFHTNLPTYSEMFGFGFLKSTMWRWNRYLHQQCRATFCPSPSTLKMLQRQGLENVKIWPRGVDMKMFTRDRRSLQLRSQWLGDCPEQTVLLYVGRLSWEKNLKLLIAAFAEMDQDQCHLVFVGDGPARQEMENSLQGLNTTLMGHLTGQDLATAYASADIFAFPSYSETFGQVVLEALASGLPVVGLRSEGVRDLVANTRTGLLLDMTVLSAEEHAQATAVNTPIPMATPRAWSAQPYKDSSISPLSLSPSSFGLVEPTDFDLDQTSIAELRSSSELEIPSWLAGWKGHIDHTPNDINFAEKFERAVAKLSAESSSPILRKSPSQKQPEGESPGPLDCMPFEEQVTAYRGLLQTLVDHPQMRDRMSVAAVIDARKHTWYEAMESLVKGYHTVINEESQVPSGQSGESRQLFQRAVKRYYDHSMAPGKSAEVFSVMMSSSAIFIYTKQIRNASLSLGRTSCSLLWKIVSKSVAALYVMFVVWILMGIGGHTS